MTKLALCVTPRAAANLISGWSEAQQQLSVRVTAAPDGGQANQAVIKLLAKQLKVPKSALSIVSGQTSRHKLLDVNLPPEELSRRLALFG